MKNRKRFKNKWWTGPIQTRAVGQRLRLVPYWELFQADPDRVNIVIDPGPSFGAGDHASTIMALEFLEQVFSAYQAPDKPPAMLDVGTGTGVLAVAAKKLGSDLTVAFDIDPASVFNAKRNLSLNGLICAGLPQESVEIFAGEIYSVKTRFDLVTANLAAPLLIRLCGILTEVSRKDLILSGIADAMSDAVQDTFSASGWSVLSHKASEGWNAFLLQR